MSHPFTLTICVSGSIALGGASQVDRVHHSASTRDKNGRPIIPATALRGALRSTLESILRGAGQGACAGGTGLAPEAPEGDAPRPCTLGEEGQRCIACRLFGGQRELVPTDSPFFSALILGDAIATTDSGWTTRPTVGVGRATRSANDHTLAMHSVPAPAGELLFTARGRLLDRTLEAYFEAALKATTHLGAGRSRGLGHVEFRLGARDEFLGPHFDAPGAAIKVKSDALRLRIELLSPTSLGVPIADDNLRDTRREIPGAALRGAIGFALAEALEGRSDPIFEELVADTGARFSFFYPVAAADARPVDALPLPATALACKFKCAEHHPLDGLLDAIAATLASDLTTATRVVQTARSAQCPACKGPLRSHRGPRACLAALRTRTLTRLALDRMRGSARNEMLFTQVLLEPGAVFEGTIHKIPPEARERLALALQQPLAIGRGRVSGWGQIRLTPLSPLDCGPLKARAAAFHRALGERLAQAGLAHEHAQRWVPITLSAPLIPDEGDEDGSAALTRLLPAKVAFRARRFTREGGWDQRQQGMSPALAVAAGGVFALQLHEGLALGDVLPKLADLEREGLGLRRHQGYGALRCFDSFHCGSLS